MTPPLGGNVHAADSLNPHLWFAQIQESRSSFSTEATQSGHRRLFARSARVGRIAQQAAARCGRS
jgi:hypothetical protein